MTTWLSECEPIPRILFVSHGCYLDDSNGAAVASRALMETLAHRGFPARVLCGSMLDSDREFAPADWLLERGHTAVHQLGDRITVDPKGVRAGLPAHLRLAVGGVSITIHLCTTTRLHELREEEACDFLRLFEHALECFHPDVLVTYGGDRAVALALSIARSRGVATVFALHNFHYRDPGFFADVDAVIVASAFAANYYREALGLSPTVLPYLVDHARARAATGSPHYLTFVNPSPEKGVYAFARIADELGRRRPDIPFLVVEGRGTEATVASCGLDLRAHGNTFFMSHTPDPKTFWELTRICLLPSLWWENQPLVAVEAMINGIPVIASDRGGIPEALGRAGTTLPLPERLTPTTKSLPTPDEVEPWVQAITRLWDDPDDYAEHSRRASTESRRWDTEALATAYEGFFLGLRGGQKPPSTARKFAYPRALRRGHLSVL
jgi:glycosyltransferase involved in cell wall biosynthesis